MSTRSKYQTATPIGRGASGEVLRTWDSELGRPVALKLLHRLDRDAAERLAREARAQARVDHPHVARVYEVGELDGRPYIAMQLVEGEPLDRAAADLGVDEKVRLFVPVAEAVQAAHAAGLVHRDLKPSNVLVERREDGRLHPYVLDFGISRVHDVPGLTVTGEVVGTPPYMSPEQASGLTRELDRRSDVFSLGVVLYELLAGRRPFQADSMVGLLNEILHHDPPTLRRIDPRLPGDLDAIVGRCLEKVPERRYPSVRALADDLERYLAGDPVAARSPGPLERLERWIRRHRVAAAALATALAALVLFGSAAVYSGLAAQRRALAAQRFGREVERIQSILRRDYMLPLHDTRPARAEVRSRMRAIEERLDGRAGAAAAPGHYALGRAHLALGELEPARRRLERALELAPGDPDAAYALGLVLGRLYRQRLDEVVRVRSGAERERLESELRAELRDPAVLLLARARGSEQESPLYLEGLIAFYEERWGDAAARGREAAGRHPWLYEARALEAEALVRRGHGHSIAGDFEAARRDFEAAGAAYAAALEVGRSDPLVLATECQRQRLVLALEMMAAGPDEAGFEAAHEACERGTVADPEHGRAWRELANLEWRYAEFRERSGRDGSEHLDHAVAAARRALELEPERAVDVLTDLAIAHELRAQLAIRNGADPEPELARVVEINRRILELAPRWDRAHGSIANAFNLRAEHAAATGGDPLPHLETAADHLRRAIEIDPIYAWHGNLASILGKTAERVAERGGDALPTLEEALHHGRVAVEKNPDYYGNWYLHARSCLLHARLAAGSAEAAGALDEGIAAAERALAIHPGHRGAREVLDELEALRGVRGRAWSGRGRGATVGPRSETAVPFRLVIQDGERRLAFPLPEGEHLVGAGEDCGVRLAHPTVSRRHARLVVAGGGLTVEDLGSRNGTRVGGERVGRHELAAGETGAAVAFGSLAGRLEAVEERDLVAGVELAAPSPQAVPPASPEPNAGAPATTAGFGSLSAFTLERLPALLERLEERPGRREMATRVGEALWATLPCVRVAIAARAGEGEEGLLFVADHGGTAPAEAAVPWGGGEVRAGFLHPAQAESFRPVLEVAASLLRMAVPRPPEAREARTRIPPPLPDPPTVVPAMRELYRDAARVARGDIGVLVTGESGTGKEVFARYLHRASPRAGGPFVALNCAALPRDLLESELFGVEKGVATGVEPRPGRFEQADGGTLFLDEIGDMAPETQARILRVLQEGEVYRLGGQAPRSARVRVVAATNRDVEAMLARGTFRTDLYHRIADWRVELPPLRERRADVPNLAAWFLAREAAKHGLAVAGISQAAVEVLQAQDWPGNVRQLEREMARAALFLEEGQLLQTVHLHPELRRSASGGAPRTLKQRLEEVERREIARALDAAGGKATAAARELGIGRTTLYRRMRELGVDPPGRGTDPASGW